MIYNSTIQSHEEENGFPLSLVPLEVRENRYLVSGSFSSATVTSCLLIRDLNLNFYKADLFQCLLFQALRK